MIGKQLSPIELWRDRVRRHGLYYVIKLIEKNEPPKIIINSFWRSGSTYLLELLANTTGMRPYFEPLTPRERSFGALYKHLNFNFNLDRLHPDVDSNTIGLINQTIEKSKYHENWVYQNADLGNFKARNGKVMKVVTGAHILPHINKNGIKLIHLQRDVKDVAKSFVNSAWTKRFFKDVDLRYLMQSKDPSVSRFYQPVESFLNLGQFQLHESVAIYKTLTDEFVKRQMPQILLVTFENLKTNPKQVLNQILDKTGVALNDEKFEAFQYVPSRMTVYNQNKRNLNEREIQDIDSIVERLKSILSIHAI